MTQLEHAPWAQWRLTGQESLFYWHSLTAYHCSAEAPLAGVPFPRSFDSLLALRQSWSTRLKSLPFDLDAPVPCLNKGISCQEKGDKNCSWAGWPKGLPSLDQWLRVLQMCARETSHSALDCSANNPERLLCSPCAFGQSLYRVLTREIERECTRWW